jgi:mRNA-degrading endonuclease RelE of RelBE toxin-antitoxin system
MTSKKGGPGPQKKSSAKRSYKLVFARPADRALKELKGKDKDLVLEALRIIKANPYDPAHCIKLHGKWKDFWKVTKGGWRVVYQVEGYTVSIAYIRPRNDTTYQKR